MPDFSAELARIDQAIATQESMRDVLSADQIELILAALREKRVTLLALNTGSGAIAQGDHPQAAGAGGVNVGGNVYGNIYTGPPPKDSVEALSIYRRVVAQQCGHLPLRGVDVGTSDPMAAQKPLGLANVYVDLDTRTGQSALRASIANRQLVLLGDPGGGKSTFVNHLAHCLAMNVLQPEGKWLDHLPNWPTTEADLLPIVVILRDFASGLPNVQDVPSAEPSHLWNFIVERLTAQNLSFAQDPIHQALEHGRAFVLLDGLDEVPTVSQRAFVRNAVMAFSGRYPDNRFLITCRVLSYQSPAMRTEPDLRLPPEVPAFELMPFDDAQIDRFVAAWYTELARLGVIRAEDADGLTRQLKDAVRKRDLRRLAHNPLLLTVMSLVHTHRSSTRCPCLVVRRDDRYLAMALGADQARVAAAATANGFHAT